MKCGCLSCTEPKNRFPKAFYCCTWCFTTYMYTRLKNTIWYSSTIQIFSATSLNNDAELTCTWIVCPHWDVHVYFLVQVIFLWAHKQCELGAKLNVCRLLWKKGPCFLVSSPCHHLVIIIITFVPYKIKSSNIWKDRNTKQQLYSVTRVLEYAVSKLFHLGQKASEVVNRNHLTSIYYEGDIFCLC